MRAGWPAFLPVDDLPRDPMVLGQAVAPTPRPAAQRIPQVEELEKRVLDLESRLQTLQAMASNDPGRDQLQRDLTREVLLLHFQVGGLKQELLHG
ncbi:MAG: hypothetical protein WC326_08385 [Candidatus Delongbacteria bacterium]